MCSGRTLISAVLGMAAIAGLPGCDDVVSSQDVPTAELYSEIHVRSFGEGITLVTADLKAGGPDSTTYVDLEDGDRYVVSVNTPYYAGGAHNNLFSQLNAQSDEHRIMNGGPDVYTGIPLPLFDQTAALYRARFDVARVGDKFIVSLERSELQDAPDSSVVLPAEFQIVAPAANTLASRNSDLVVAWTPALPGAAAMVRARLDCGTTNSTERTQELASDSGVVTFPAQTFTDPNPTCNLQIQVDRYVIGTIDPHYGYGGTIVAHQQRLVGLKSIP